jgi:hypothetical protein
MKYIGKYIPAWFDGYTWDHGDYTRCPVETVDDYLTCIHYEPADTVEWDCKHVNGDICEHEEAK